MTEQNQQSEAQPQFAPEVVEQVHQIVEQISAVLEGKPADSALTAMLCVVGAAITGPTFEAEQKKNAALFMLSMASKITVDVGVSDTEIMSAMVQPEFYGDKAQQAPESKIIV